VQIFNSEKKDKTEPQRIRN